MQERRKSKRLLHKHNIGMRKEGKPRNLWLQGMNQNIREQWQ